MKCDQCMNEEYIPPQRHKGAKGRKEGRKRLSNGVFCLPAILRPTVPAFVFLCASLRLRAFAGGFEVMWVFMANE